MCVESLLASGGIRFAVRPFARPGGVASPSETLQCRRARNRRACQWVWACCCMRGTPCPMETAFQTTASVERPAVLGAKRTTGEFRSWRVDSPFGWQLPSQTSGLKHLHQAHQTQGSAVHKPSATSGLIQRLPPESQAAQDSGGWATALWPPLLIQRGTRRSWPRCRVHSTTILGNGV